MTIEQLLINCFQQNPDFKNSRSLLNQFVKSLNKKQNKKSLQLSKDRHDKNFSTKLVHKYHIFSLYLNSMKLNNISRAVISFL